MCWEYPICPEIKCLTLVVLRPYVSFDFELVAPEDPKDTWGPSRSHFTDC